MAKKAKKGWWKGLRPWKKGALIGLAAYLVYNAIVLFLGYTANNAAFLTMLLFVGIPAIVAGALIGYFLGRKS